MPMKMGWRWYGEGNDPVTLSDIKQIPGVTSIVWALHNKMPGEIWEIDEIQKVAEGDRVVALAIQAPTHFHRHSGCPPFILLCVCARQECLALSLIF